MRLFEGQSEIHFSQEALQTMIEECINASTFAPDYNVVDIALETNNEFPIKVLIEPRE